ncbi:MAG: hypothetical protein MJZ41_08145, partial [Bacteroidaceae bacterium]|nr:hypothetical protein [Bacteroidaceae bacterium]
MTKEELDKKIGMPDVDAEWAKFRKEVIMPSQKANHHFAIGQGWRKIAAVFLAIMCLSCIAIASVVLVQKHMEEKEPVIDKSIDTKPLVEYRQVSKHRSGYIVHVCPGIYVQMADDKQYIEEEYQLYFFLDLGNLTMTVDGVPFDKESLPDLTNKDLLGIRRITHGDSITINLMTKDVVVPQGVIGNLPRTQTILLPGGGEALMLNRKGVAGDWVHGSIAPWEKDQFDYCMADELSRAKKVTNHKVYIYASTETEQSDIDRALSILADLGIKNYEVVKDIPIAHWTDAQFRKWAQEQKEKHPEYDYNYLFDELATTHNGDDLHEKWHIIKEVYGVKNKK